ncbi:MAG: efflux RND transporter periplasmic adaptor subunit, partial [Fimbriimonadaceae bacterium]|nr:efflux RND transporter periplasmic adaptor subunit [Chitinophagales bacterium]
VSMFLTACGKMKQTGEEHGHEEEQSDEHGRHEGLLAILTPAQYKKLNIQLGDIEQRNLTGTIKTTGFLKVPPQNKADITSLIGGTVQNILVQEGDYVRKGETLITIANPEFIKMQESYITAQSELLYAESDLNRQKQLSENNVSAKKALQQAQTNYDVLQSKINSLKKQFVLINMNSNVITADNMQSVISITSPINGNVGHIDINLGSAVSSGNIIMEVIDNSKIHIDAFVFEQDLPKIKIGQKINFTLTNLQGKSYEAKIFGLGSSFEDASKTIPVHAEITGDKTGLIEGMSITAFIEIENIYSSVVPSQAIVSEGGKDYVFIWALDHQAELNMETEHTDHEEEDGHEHAEEKEHEHDDESVHEHAEGDETHEAEEKTHSTENYIPKETDKWVFEKMPVKKGITQGGYTEIIPLGDYMEGEKIVFSGAFYLLSSLSNEGEAHAH